MGRSVYVLLIALAVMVLSCSKIEKPGTDDSSCERVDCTEIFMHITVRVADLSNRPIALDRIKVIRIPDGKDMTHVYDSHEWMMAAQSGSYMLANDMDSSHLARHKHTKLRFFGYIGNREVVKEDYIVSSDCCHIALVSGQQELIITD
jgi:hypothetical protein